MPFFEKRKRKNNEKHSLWITLIPLLLSALIGLGVALFFVADEPQASMVVNQTNRIGLFAGHHYNESDLGATCADGLTERSINGSVVKSLAAELTAQGYTVDVYYDYSEKLNGYRADLLLVIHGRGCADELPSGYRIINMNDLATLEQCLAHYEAATDLERLAYTAYMDGYPRFSQTAQSTPIMLIEMGTLIADRDLLTSNQSLVVEGLMNTVTCFSPMQTQEADKA